MTDLENKGKSEKAVNDIPVLVKTGFEVETIIELVPGSSVVRTVLDAIAGERGCTVEELMLYCEGDEEPLAESVLVEAGYPHRRRHHVHHAGEVKVSVSYQADSRHLDFKRNATIGDVLAWAIDIFNIDQSMATEFELARHGQKEELSPTEHVGHLAGRHRELDLDLVRGDIANGSYQ